MNRPKIRSSSLQKPQTVCFQIFALLSSLCQFQHTVTLSIGSCFRRSNKPLHEHHSHFSGKNCKNSISKHSTGVKGACVSNIIWEWLTLGDGHQRDELAEDALGDGRAVDKTRVVPAVWRTDGGDVEIPGGLRHEPPLIQRDEVRKLVQHPAEGQILCRHRKWHHTPDTNVSV